MVLHWCWTVLLQKNSLNGQKLRYYRGFLLLDHHSFEIIQNPTNFRHIASEIPKKNKFSTKKVTAVTKKVTRIKKEVKSCLNPRKYAIFQLSEEPQEFQERENSFKILRAPSNRRRRQRRLQPFKQTPL